MIEHGPAHGLHWTRAIVMLTTNVGVEYSKRIAQDRAKVRRRVALQACTDADLHIAKRPSAIPSP